MQIPIESGGLVLRDEQNGEIIPVDVLECQESPSLLFDLEPSQALIFRPEMAEGRLIEKRILKASTSRDGRTACYGEVPLALDWMAWTGLSM